MLMVETLERAPELITNPLMVLDDVGAVITPDAIVPAPEILPEESITIDGVLRKLVKPVVAPKLIPLTVPLAAATKLSKFEVLVPDAGAAAACSVKVKPFTASPAAAVLLFLNVKLERLAAAVLSDESVKLVASPETAVEVTVNPVRVPTEVIAG